MNNKLSMEELRARLDALLRAGVIDRAAYERKLEEARAASASSPRQAQQDPGRSAGRQNSAPRVDQSNIASAPYRFVPIAPGWVVAPEATTGPLSAPKPEGYMAEIEVEFTVESPLLIGDDQGNKGDVHPLTMGDGRNGLDWVIPGSTLRGWLRSELEIVGFARLDQYNRNRVFGLRDFDHAGYGDDQYPVADVGQLKGGWIRRIEAERYRELCRTAADNRQPPPSEFEIAECPAWYVVQADDIARLYGSGGKADFTQNELLAKYETVGMTAWIDKVKVIDLAAGLRRLPSVEPGSDINGKPQMRLGARSGGNRRGHFVFSGRAPSGKRLEYWFDTPGAWEDLTWYVLSRARWNRFEDINATRVGNDVRPQGSYEAAAPTLKKGLPVPVFFVGDPAISETRGARDRFAFGLTRLFKVPHRHDLRTIVERSGHRRPNLLDPDGNGNRSRIKADFVENLFGYVHEPDEWRKDPSDETAPPRDFARKGRIAVSAARLIGDRPVSERRGYDTVMAAAKPSFAPFYLVGPCKDYSDDNAKIAGRKVYLPRFSAATVAAGGTTSKVEELLQRQIDAIKANAAANKEFNAKITTRLSFLDPGGDGAHPKFRSRIRFFNVTAEEIGAVVWVLTHGGSPRHRHMLGRAKAFGAGQVAVALTRVDAVALFPEGTVNGGPRAPVTPTGDATVDAAAFRARFEAFMETAVRSRMEGSPQATWRSSATVTEWLAARDPEVGARLAAAGRLDTMPLRGGASGRDNPYKILRDMTKPRKDGRPTAGPNRFIDLGRR